MDPYVIRVEQDAKDLIADLKLALKRRLRSGGCYGVIRKSGDVETLHVEIRVNGKG